MAASARERSALRSTLRSALRSAPGSAFRSRASSPRRMSLARRRSLSKAGPGVAAADWPGVEPSPKGLRAFGTPCAARSLPRCRSLGRGSRSTTGGKSPCASSSEWSTALDRLCSEELLVLTPVPRRRCARALAPLLSAPPLRLLPGFLRELRSPRKKLSLCPRGPRARSWPWATARVLSRASVRSSPWKSARVFSSRAARRAPVSSAYLRKFFFG